MQIDILEVFDIEDKIKEMNYPTVDELWKSVKNKIKNREVFDVIIDYLLEENDIIIDPKERVIWINQPEVLKEFLKNRELNKLKKEVKQIKKKKRGYYY